MTTCSRNKHNLSIHVTRLHRIETNSWDNAYAFKINSLLILGICACGNFRILLNLNYSQRGFIS